MDEDDALSYVEWRATGAPQTQNSRHRRVQEIDRS